MLEAAPEGVIRDYLSVPLIDRSSDIHNVPLLSLDFETSGLDASKEPAPNPTPRFNLQFNRGSATAPLEP